MAEYQPIATRFLCKGLNLTAPEDALPDGKFSLLENMRSVIEGTIEPRAGTLAVASTPGQTNVHTVDRLNDATPFNGGVPAVRVAGAGPQLYSGSPNPGTALASVEGGFSGDPLTILTGQPVGTPQPWLYVADRNKQRKLNVLGQVYETGIAPPVVPPVAVLAAPRVTVIENFEYAVGTVPWLAAGTIASAPVQVMRINTTIATILYDEGATGHACLALTSMLGLGIGAVVVIGNTEQTMVQDIKIAIVDTTVEGIQYDDDVGPGLCTVQPLGSLATAQLRVADKFFTRVTPPGADFAVERGTAGTPADIDPEAVTATATRQAFIVNGLVQIGSEMVRILSVAAGKDGTRSFRCRTTSVHAAGETLKGTPTCRVYLQFTHAVGETVISQAIQNVLTPTPADVEHDAKIVGGARSGAPYFTVLPTDPITGHTDHKDTVVAAKAELIAEGVSLVGPCGSYAIVKRTAEKLAGIGCGVLKKTSGNKCDDKSVDNVCFPNGALYDVLIDAGNVAAPGVEGANTPQWGFNGFVDPSRYIALGANPVPETPPPVDQPFATPTDLDLSKIADRMTSPDDELHVSVNIDKLDAVLEVRVYLDCDAVQNDYTRNVFFKAFEANDLMNAVQGFNATVTVPVVDEGRATAVPRRQARMPATGPVTTQLSLGNSQWIELRWRVKDMVRVGTDPTRSLRHVQGIQLLVQASSKVGPITVQYDACWLGGGFNPDVGETGIPYTYAARYRSKATGATSRPGPTSRGGVLPRRQRVILTCQPSPDPQVDTIDYFRFGGLQPTGAYLGSAPNGDGTDQFFDDFADVESDQATRPAYREFQPWPTQEVPRRGTVRVVGSAVHRLTGDPFNARWAPDLLIRIRGIDCHLYRQPASSSFLEIHESVGTLANVPFEVPNPTVMGSPLPTLWGPFEGFYFSVGAPINPGLLTWTLGNNLDVTSDENTLYVTSPSTPLMNGFAWDNAAFVWSTEDLYRILPDFNRPNQFTANVLPCGRGLWTRWCWCLTPQGPAFLAKDGIYVTNAGAPAVSLTEGDLYPIFPHDGLPGLSIRGIDPPDMTQTTRLRLAYADGFLYFDYLTTLGTPCTLVCDLKAMRWFLDRYPVGAVTHTSEEGAGVHHVLAGRSNGTISEYRHRVGDDAAPIPYRFRSPLVDGGDPRKEKLIGDLVLDFDPDGGAGVTVTPGLDDYEVALPPSAGVGAGASGRGQYILDINNGTGVLAQNVGIDVVGADAAQVPRFFLWEASVIPKAEETAKRATDWEDAEYFGAKFMQGVLIEADTEGAPRTIRVEYDGGQLGAVVTVTGSPGELQTAHSFQTPFIAHLLRLLPTDDNEWLHYRHRWVWEPSPELAAYWITQPTTHDFPGYGQVERVLIAHMSLVDFDLTVTADGRPQTYRIPASANAFVKTEILQRPNKGKVYQYELRATDGTERMRIFLKDCEVRAKPWGHPDPYQILRPFGDLSREFGGARI